VLPGTFLPSSSKVVDRRGVMDFAAGILALLLLGYLVVALIRPDRLG